MASERFKPNLNIATSNLEREEREILEKIQPNLNHAVDTVVNNFFGEISRRADEFQKGDKYDSMLESAVDEVKRDLASEFSAISLLSDNIMDKAIKLEQALQSNAALTQALKDQASDLAKAQQELDEKISSINEKVATFGAKSGRLVATTVMKTLTGGILS